MNSALKLYEISNQFQALEQLGDSDDLPAEVIANTLEALEGDFDTKAVQVAKFILSLEANASATMGAAKAMTERAARIAKRAESIRAYLQFHMQALEKKRIESHELVINRRVNPPAVIITDEHAVPAQFWVQPPPPPPRLDKKAIKEAIDAGERVEGAYVEAAERLEIRL
jgi:Siphovirus Gp157